MIPFNFNSLTVKQYQTLNEIFDSQDDLLDKQINAIAYLTKKSIKDVEELPLDLFKYHASQLSFIKNPEINTKVKKYVYVGARFFKGCTQVEKLTQGQYVDLKELAKDGLGVKNLHKLLAVIYQPVIGKRNHQKDSEVMLNAKMGDVYGLLFFYTSEYERLKDFIQMSLEEALETIATEMEEMKTELVDL